MIGKQEMLIKYKPRGPCPFKVAVLVNVYEKIKRENLS